ncbi:MAG: dimethylsulfoniopropionate demethylase [Gammaproteobacteria bacterium]|nr:dimethylsulfoniopropionate demethylase [Gammaproteobacteria bacterium]
MSSGLVTSRRNRRTPYTDSVEKLGVSGYSIVNHTLLPKSFQKTVEEDYWHLKEHVQLWDVGCQRQVELRGPDAARLAQWMTPRDLRSMSTGQCFYAPLIDHRAGLLNDPVVIKRAEDWFWFSIADSDVLLWAKGLALGRGLDVEVDEPDVWPLAVQGPKAEECVARVFGEKVRSAKYFEFVEGDFSGHRLVVARSNLDRFCHLGGEFDYIGREALESIAQAGPSQRMRGVLIDGGPCPPCGKPWPVFADGRKVGQITSAIWSPFFEKNVGLSLIKQEAWNPGAAIAVEMPNGDVQSGVVVELPFMRSS